MPLQDLIERRLLGTSPCSNWVRFGRLGRRLLGTSPCSSGATSGRLGHRLCNVRGAGVHSSGLRRRLPRAITTTVSETRPPQSREHPSQTPPDNLTKALTDVAGLFHSRAQASCTYPLTRERPAVPSGVFRCTIISQQKQNVVAQTQNNAQQTPKSYELFL